MKIGIIGSRGVVGTATTEVFRAVHEIYPYDKYKSPDNTEKNFEDLASKSEVVFVCVPTPMKPSGEMDYSAIFNSLNGLKDKTEKVGRNPSEILVTIRSTATSGTTDKFAEQYPFRFAFNPEFLTEKNASEDMKNTDRVVIGVEDKESENKLLSVYKPLFPNANYIIVNRKTAEMIKYTANVILTGQIAIANEIYQICKHAGVDYDTVKQAILLDKRIGRNINVPGHDGDLGFGGKCFPKDLNALIYLARECGYRPHLLEEMWSLNERVRKNRDWIKIPGATSQNVNFTED